MPFDRIGPFFGGLPVDVGVRRSQVKFVLLGT
jgi:hypothetical protein